MIQRITHAIQWRLEAFADFRDKLVRRWLTTGLPESMRRFRCPVCEAKVGGFRPLPRTLIEPMRKYGCLGNLADAETLNVRNYSCPACNASDRDRLYALALASRLAAAPVRLLDIAPSCPLAKFLARFPQLQRRTADLFKKDVDDNVDVTDMHIYPEGTFDAVICSHVLEHVPDDRKAMHELFRVLKPGGWGVIMVPINLKATQIDEDPNVSDEAERWRRFGQCDHVRRYSKAGFLDRMREAGFELQHIGVEQIGAETFARCGITNRSVLYLAEKPGAAR